uniref:Uncharacterized protein n=1 Tax=viral metagenome TaxID=1070528 RepID=A0A6C0LRD7_9ZZZZ
MQSINIINNDISVSQKFHSIDNTKERLNIIFCKFPQLEEAIYHFQILDFFSLMISIFKIKIDNVHILKNHMLINIVKNIEKTKELIELNPLTRHDVKDNIFIDDNVFDFFYQEEPLDVVQFLIDYFRIKADIAFFKDSSKKSSDPIWDVHKKLICLFCNIKKNCNLDQEITSSLSQSQNVIPNYLNSNFSQQSKRIQKSIITVPSIQTSPNVFHSTNVVPLKYPTLPIPIPSRRQYPNIIDPPSQYIPHSKRNYY